MQKTGTLARLNIKRGSAPLLSASKKTYTALCLFIHWHMNAQRTRQPSAASYKPWKIWRAFLSFFFSFSRFLSLPLSRSLTLSPRFSLFSFSSHSLSPRFHLPISLRCESMSRQLRSSFTWEVDGGLLTFKRRGREDTVVLADRGAAGCCHRVLYSSPTRCSGIGP